MHDTYSQYEQTHLVLKVGFCVNVYIKRFEGIHTHSGIEVGREGGKGRMPTSLCILVFIIT